MSRGLKFRIQKVEGLYYLCSENKGADQLRGYRKADLILCFCICKKPFSHDGAHIVSVSHQMYFDTVHKKSLDKAILIRVCITFLWTI